MSKDLEVLKADVKKLMLKDWTETEVAKLDEFMEDVIIATMQVNKLPIHVVTQRSELVCDCLPMSTQVSTINGRYICCTCNKPLLSQTCG